MGGTLLDEPIATPGDDDRSVPSGRPERGRRRFGLVGTVAAVGLVAIAATFAVRGGLAYRRDHPAGSTRSLTLTYQCAQDVGWHQPSSHWEWQLFDETNLGALRGTDRWPDVDHRVRGFDTAALRSAPAGQVPFHTAAGRLHFDTNTTATFTSDGGGSIHLRRIRADRLFGMGCEMTNS